MMAREEEESESKKREVVRVRDFVSGWVGPIGLDWTRLGGGERSPSRR